MIAIFAGLTAVAAEVDSPLLQSLNSEANHDQVRRKSFKNDRDAKKIYDSEREKELSLFLEEQEKWELIRERGLAEHRKQRKSASPADDGPEFQADFKVKQAQEKKREEARLQAVQTRAKITINFSPTRDRDELEELNLVQLRPRFDLRKRGKNKWVKGSKSGGSSSGSSGSSGSGGGYSPPPAAFDDFPIQPDFMPAPAVDGFEEIPPPPPPPVNYDGSGGNYGIDSGFGDIPPPPPPPLLDDDF